MNSLDIKPVCEQAQIGLSHKLQKEIFHHELSLFGMEIPDRYDISSLYMHIRESNKLVGTYRIVFPNSEVGMPIEETGFDVRELKGKKICEMSRLVLLKEQRGKIPFYRIIRSASKVAKENQASILLVAILPRNFPLFQRAGFSQVGPPLPDPSVRLSDGEEGAIIPMQMKL
ncbi:N-acyl amino acid synthase FeeM domain-containing protein [Roseofilum casamattae]|uniref:GNAT family N-acetyltransferase n=1 Tax=Roseofilum casamattae BLCC-M143 TaxID=3022442 RepID=A0ABT7BZL1_9CYAN|nr:GNAT family N-acyltransferase [Roseofilum casamattae]MDJ1183904.1 GNAT family N-acetyltransferase [Roseofilum casamattae BLCC-M143]